MPADDLALNLRIRADFAQAVGGFKAVQRELGQVRRAGAGAGTGTRAASAGLRQIGVSAPVAAQAADLASRGLRREAEAAIAAGLASRRAADGMDDLGPAAGRAGGGLRRLTAGLGLATAGYLAWRASLAGVREIKEAGLQAERLDSTLRFAEGSSAGAARGMAFVRAEADRLGVSLVASAEGYARIAAAARGTSLQRDARQLFADLATGARALNLTGEQTTGLLQAVEQIISKGVVSAEELRGQIGERLPGAFQIAARAMGVSVEELNRLLERGELAADEFLPRFGRQIRAEMGDAAEDAASRSEAAFERMNNALFDLEVAVANSGVLEFLADLARGTTRVLQAVTPDADPAAPYRDLAGELAVVAREIAAVEEELARRRASPAASDAGIRALQERIDGLRAEEAALREQLRRDTLAVADVEQGAATLAPLTVDAPAQPDARELRAAERAAAEVARIAAAAENARARIVLDRIRQSERAEAMAVARLRELGEVRLVDAAVIETAIAAVRRRRAAERGKIAQDAAAREAAAAGRRTTAEERAAERAAQGRARAHERAVGQIAAAERGLAGARDRARLEARAWADEVLAGLDRQAEGYERLAAAVEAIVVERTRRAVADAEEEALRSATDLRSGAVRAFRDIAAESADAATTMERAMRGAATGMTDAIAGFAATGRADVADLVQSIIADFARLGVQQNITGPLFAALGQAIGIPAGGGGGADIPIAHAGRTIGAPGGRRRRVPAAAFLAAPRAHDGLNLGPDEVPIIGLRGERVLNRAETRAYGRAPEVTVNVVNRGRPVSAEVGEARFDGRRAIVDVVVDDIAAGGRTATAIRRIGAVA